LWESIHVGPEICSREDKVIAEWVSSVVGEMFGTALGSRPEGLSSARGLIRREVEEELLDLIIEVFFP
jgi:hypothetical protein